MCDTCGCDTLSVRTIELSERLLASNLAAARHNRDHFKEQEIFTINLMGAPGSGKTTLLEATIRNWRYSNSIHVIEGDQATQRDSERIRAAGANAFQVETGLGCHLDASQVHAALHNLKGNSGDILFIENVGNLVCPALFDLGESLRVVVTNPAEGADKPLKYPPMFRAAHIVVLNKYDLLEHVPFQLKQWSDYVFGVNPHARIITASALTGFGIADWVSEIEYSRCGFVGGSER
jgi:hydrogenase nickel incorporation protein HypB